MCGRIARIGPAQTRPTPDGQFQVEDILTHPSAVFNPLGRGGLVREHQTEGKFASIRMEDLLDLLIKVYAMTEKISPDFEAFSFSDLDYEGMSVEIRYQGVPVAQINKDKGPENCEIQIPSRFSPGDANFVFPLEDFVNALNSARHLIADLG
ncbi:hypothetical protein [Acidovorax sp. SUPP2539]|uniref:hypothetical protein n=1 Tax=Acidovorax sp. SUPP2539 TaxID=2920878 RepID=UPI0023DE4D3A|nr:hypothetical protein [Acidovorax sp. SUPP2539]GKS90703.1 hypothetical protein AVTE2539_15080 [Acidovorax sp. SUPP2539]